MHFNLAPPVISGAWLMLIKNMDEVEIKKTVLGICCPDCGGNLKMVEKRRLFLAPLMRLLLFRKRVRSLVCENCRKKFTLI